MPSISVIVPVYKVEPYLRRCVDSLRNQTFSDLELILVDDGSPDSCGSICEEYAVLDSRIHVIHQENGGLSAARNTGIDWAMEYSDSRWLAFVDSDDWVAPEYLEMLHRAVTETGSRVSACDLVTTAGEPLPEAEAFQVEVLSSEDYYCSQTARGDIAAVAPCKLYEKNLFASVRYPVGKLHEDEFTTYRLIYAAGTVAVTPMALYAYFQNTGGIMQSQWNPRRLHGLEAAEQQIAFAREKGFPRLRRKAVEQYAYDLCSHLQQIQALPEYSEYLRPLRQKLRWALSACREYGVLPLNGESLWAYELAYPIKPVWWLVFKIKERFGSGEHG